MDTGATRPAGFAAGRPGRWKGNLWPQSQLVLLEDKGEQAATKGQLLPPL